VRLLQYRFLLDPTKQAMYLFPVRWTSQTASR
jgi:hypothetical protein